MELMIDRLSKQYGSKIAVDRISLKLEKGVYGLLGANGAGKTTLMRLLCGILKPTGGTVSLDGADVTTEEYRSKLGYLPQDFGYYPDFTGRDFLLYMAALKGLSKAEAKKKSAELLNLVDLKYAADKKIKTYSGGMKQRLGIAQALLGNPKVIILDEPTVGLDPIQIIEIRDLITELGQTHTVIFSSHILSEVQAICDQILMIAKGKLVAFGEPEELQRQLLAPNEIVLTTSAVDTELAAVLEGVEHITEITTGATDSEYTVAHIQTDCEDIYELSGAVFRAFAASEHIIYEMTLKKGNLEDMFIELSENAGAADKNVEDTNEAVSLPAEETASEVSSPSMEGIPTESEDYGV